jgi:hypothetical protein
MTRRGRGRDTSYALTEVRTVWKRAKSALDRLDHLDEYLGTYYSDDEIDPDTPEIRAALEQVVELLEPWKRTGRKSR